MRKERKLALLRQVLKQPGKSLGNDEYAFFCPKHGLRPGRTVGQLGVNVSSDRFNCYSCGFKGHTLLFLFPYESSEWKEYKESLAESKPHETKKQYEDVHLPSGFRSLSHQWKSPYAAAVRNYIYSRGLTDDDIVMWKLGYSEEGDYKNRVIIPSFDEFGMLNFVTGRAIYDGMDRYWNGRFDKDIIFNDYMIDWRLPVSIVEGPFDAFKARDNVIALFGSLLSPGTRLFSKIVLSGVDVYLALDSDAYSKQMKILSDFTSYGSTCHIVPLGDRKDVGEMTHAEFASAKHRSRTVSSPSDLIMMRIRDCH